MRSRFFPSLIHFYSHCIFIFSLEDESLQGAQDVLADTNKISSTSPSASKDDDTTTSEAVVMDDLASLDVLPSHQQDQQLDDEEDEEEDEDDVDDEGEKGLWLLALYLFIYIYLFISKKESLNGSNILNY